MTNAFNRVLKLMTRVYPFSSAGHMIGGETKGRKLQNKDYSRVNAPLIPSQRERNWGKVTQVEECSYSPPPRVSLRNERAKTCPHLGVSEVQLWCPSGRPSTPTNLSLCLGPCVIRRSTSLSFHCLNPTAGDSLPHFKGSPEDFTSWCM